MAGYVATGAVRELLVVLAVAVTGLLLATLVAFTPWYEPPVAPERPVVVEMHAPDRPPVDTGLATGDGG
jgi:hypothetical protein